MKLTRLHLIWTAIAVCLLLLSVGTGFVWTYTAQKSVPKQVSIVLAKDGTGLSKQQTLLKSDAALVVGGMKETEALQLLASRKQALEQLAVTIDGGSAMKIGSSTTKDGKKRTWTLAELGISVSIADAQSAIEKLKQGSMWDRARYRWNFPRELAIRVAFDRNKFVQRVQSQWGYLNTGEPVNAKRTITTQDEVVYWPHKDAYRLDTEKMFAHAVTAVEAALRDNWKVSDGTTPMKPMTWPLALKAVHPNVTLDRLKGEGIDRLLVAFTTEFATSGAGRAYNVTMTARTLNDWDLAPGEVFDYSTVIKQTNKQYRYRQAPVILNGAFVPGIGGGICQVSSTLYNAVLLAGLDMVERRNHSLPVAYLPLGRDATYADDAINFRFENTTGKHLLIRTVVEGRKLTVKLFGTMPQGVSYSLESATIGTVVPPVKEMAKVGLVRGERQLVTEGKPGYVVETYRIKKVGGKQVSRTRISRDVYKAQPVVYAVSPEQAKLHGGGAAKEKPLLEDGVGQ
ncbi:VanW family protein [Paenibacillus sp. OV219]|uniref:VanW family protein n=1 Tax=Paenibacillus sp. OV219 TaxID=1884377 RepID=UPI0008B51B48|nr:VanW family protein [Paenibacillus sp. OV219]SEN66381.1 Vancomycin resistance protein YoaR, contains peptidoglycan-binding and VanW domains [Paenibacillus sp. OV219]